MFFLCFQIKSPIHLLYLFIKYLSSKYANYFEAITSISTKPPLGKVLTATAERAGKSNLKYFA